MQTSKEYLKSIEDLKQFVTNLLYAAYSDGANDIKSHPFDKWVKEKTEELGEYYHSQFPPSKPVTDEDIQNAAKEFQFDNQEKHRVKYLINSLL